MLKGKRFKIAKKVLQEESDACEKMLDEVYRRQVKIHCMMFQNGFISKEEYEKAQDEYGIKSPTRA